MVQNWAGSEADRSRVAGLIRAGLASGQSVEVTNEYFSCTEQGYLCCALGMATIGLVGGDVVRAHEMFYNGPSWRKEPLHSRLANTLDLPASLVSQIDQSHHAGRSARAIANELEASVTVAVG